MGHHRKTTARRRAENRMKLYTAAGATAFVGTLAAVLWAGGAL